MLLNNLKHLFVDENRHDVDWDVDFCRHEHGVQLSVGMIEREEANPALVSDCIFAGSFKFGFLDVLEEDGLFGVGDQVAVGLGTLVRRSNLVDMGHPQS